MYCKVPVCCACQVEVDYSTWCKCDESNLEVWAAEKPGQQKQFTTPLSHHHKDITILGVYNILTHWRVLINSFTVSELCPALTIVLFEADGHQSHQNTELQNMNCELHAMQFQKHWKTSSGLVTLYCVHSSWELCVNTASLFLSNAQTCTCFGNLHSRMLNEQTAGQSAVRLSSHNTLQPINKFHCSCQNAQAIYYLLHSLTYSEPASSSY